MGLKKYIDNPGMLLFFLGKRECLNWISDETYIKMLFKVHFGYNLNLDAPKTYNEKLQWLKLHEKNSEYEKYADKYEVRQIVQNLLGSEYLIPLLWVGDKFEDIPFSSLPDQFVIKCTHDSGSVVVCKDKSQLDKNKTKKFIEKHLKMNMFWAGREWVYKNLKPRIIIEKYMGSDVSYPEDYKFYVFNGKIDCVMICKDRDKGYPKFYFYDEEWNRLHYLKDEPADDVEKPDNFEQMLNVVKKLNVLKYPAIRIDLYDVNGQIYFGEYTFFNQGGFDLDISRATDEHWGELMDLKSHEEKR